MTGKPFNRYEISSQLTDPGSTINPNSSGRGIPAAAQPQPASCANTQCININYSYTLEVGPNVVTVASNFPVVTLLPCPSTAPRNVGQWEDAFTFTARGTSGQCTVSAMSMVAWVQPTQRVTEDYKQAIDISVSTFPSYYTTTANYRSVTSLEHWTARCNQGVPAFNSRPVDSNSGRNLVVSTNAGGARGANVAGYTEASSQVGFSRSPVTRDLVGVQGLVALAHRSAGKLTYWVQGFYCPARSGRSYSPLFSSNNLPNSVAPLLDMFDVRPPVTVDDPTGLVLSGMFGPSDFHNLSSVTTSLSVRGGQSGLVVASQVNEFGERRSGNRIAYRDPFTTPPTYPGPQSRFRFLDSGSSGEFNYAFIPDVT